MRIKKGDTVIITTGEYKGVKGRVLKSFPKNRKVIVEKVNFIKKHERPSQKNPAGGIIEKEAPIDVSNIQLICPKCGEKTKPTMKILSDKTRARICKKCQDII
ncbi:MAG: 50S ribosomal protein L24 [Candidatus Cloacimonadota bacterium]|nr:MAG: 50S ribosomal protein L24 [Candidatus Cloacimonadota bacterium]